MYFEKNNIICYKTLAKKKTKKIQTQKTKHFDDPFQQVKIFFCLKLTMLLFNYLKRYIRFNIKQKQILLLLPIPKLRRRQLLSFPKPFYFNLLIFK